MPRYPHPPYTVCYTPKGNTDREMTEDMWTKKEAFKVASELKKLGATDIIVDFIDSGDWYDDNRSDNCNYWIIS